MRCLNWEYAKHSGVKSSELKGRCLGSGIIQRAAKPEAELCPSFNAMPSGGRTGENAAKSRWKERETATAEVRAFGGEEGSLAQAQGTWVPPRPS